MLNPDFNFPVVVGGGVVGGLCCWVSVTFILHYTMVNCIFAFFFLWDSHQLSNLFGYFGRMRVVLRRHPNSRYLFLVNNVIGQLSRYVIGYEDSNSDCPVMNFDPSFCRVSLSR